MPMQRASAVHQAHAVGARGDQLPDHLGEQEFPALGSGVERRQRRLEVPEDPVVEAPQVHRDAGGTRHDPRLRFGVGFVGDERHRDELAFIEERHRVLDDPDEQPVLSRLEEPAVHPRVGEHGAHELVGDEHVRVVLGAVGARAREVVVPFWRWHHSRRGDEMRGKHSCLREHGRPVCRGALAAHAAYRQSRRHAAGRRHSRLSYRHAGIAESSAA